MQQQLYIAIQRYDYEGFDVSGVFLNREEAIGYVEGQVALDRQRKYRTDGREVWQFNAGATSDAGYGSAPHKVILCYRDNKRCTAKEREYE